MADTVTVYPKTKDFVITPIMIAQLVLMAISLALKFLMPKPKKPKPQQRPEDSHGVTGFQNTTQVGTPKFVVYGRRRVFGAVIGSRVDVNSAGTGMEFRVLYFMGDTGGDGYEAITSVQINESDIANFTGVSVETRLGTPTQAIIPGFETSASNVFGDGRPLPDATDVTYTTRNNDIDRLKLIVAANAMFHTDKKGRVRTGGVSFRIQVKLNSAPVESYVDFNGQNPAFSYAEATTAGVFRSFDMVLASKDKWDVRITAGAHVGGQPRNDGGDSVLYNVQEESTTIRNYPNSALLAVFGVASNQITSLDGLRVSALVDGKKVKVWNDSSFQVIHTDKRVWIARDMLTHPVVGLGHRIPESLYNDTIALAEQTSYYDNLVNAFGGGTEVRDRCDVIVGDRKAGWDWLKEDILGEGRAALIPSGGKLKYVIRRSRTPNLLYAYPGNIIDRQGGPVKRILGRASKSINAVTISYMDVEGNYRPNALQVKDGGIGSDPIRDEPFQYDTVVRESQIFHEATIRVKENALIKRHFNWQSPSTAQVSEPLDVDNLAYITPLKQKFAGKIPESGSSLDTIHLGTEITLDAGKVYEILLRHQANNAVERRTLVFYVVDEAGNRVTDDAGNLVIAESFGGVVHTVNVNPPLATAPAAEDLWAVGEQNVGIIPVTLVDIRPDENGNFELTADEYVPEVFSPGALPSQSTRRSFGLRPQAPIPIRDAQVIEQFGLNADGVFSSTIVFNVTPGLSQTGGKAQGGTANAIVLQASEPNLDNYFITAVIEIVGGTGLGQQRTITAYIGASRTAMVNSAWTVIPDPTSLYEVKFIQFGTYWGFLLERADNASGPWAEVWRAAGTRVELSGNSAGVTDYFRFTALTSEGMAATRARFVRSITTVGDGGRPADVTGFNVVQIGDRLLFTWQLVPDTDIRSYRIKDGLSWNAGGIIAEDVMHNFFEISHFPSGTHTFRIKAVDRTGNESLNDASVTVTIVILPSRKEITRVDEIAVGGGTFDDMVLRTFTAGGFAPHAFAPHAFAVVGGDMFGLAPAAEWDAGGDWDDPGGDPWDGNTVLLGSYTTPVMNLSVNGLARAYFDLKFWQFASSRYVLEVRRSTDGVSFTPFMPLTTGDIQQKAVQLRITLYADSSKADPLINQLHAVIDAPVRSFREQAKVIAIGGTVITFDFPFMAIPTVGVTPYGQLDVDLVASDRETATIKLRSRADGSDVGGVADIIVTGG